ncbi:hypothetical protein [Actinomadura livida]|uniref:Secreted protein n=1 Tax=Actinomadura livida TaxID=79909 RepID=A0A7W7IIB5_9ACTN|nr:MULTISPECIES: hypothetical protein [Actinomadura]MBB4777520.1 hypothetical protein [Actinomadura catellatispora]GGU00577.1 hypothetical protein GCM10010208_25570 [Actinomadura livida]
MKFTRLRRRSSRLALPAAVGAALLSFGLASPAAAANPDPIPASFDFSDCPTLPAGASPQFSHCWVGVVTSGTFKIGNFDQTIDKPIRITWATTFNTTTFETGTVFGGLHTEKMKIQDGLFGDPFLTAVYAKVEYAGTFEMPPGDDLRINLGIKVRIQNPLLGNNCALGSNSNPIMLNLTTGTTSPPAPNTPITGEPVSIARQEPQPTVLQAKHVGNSFAVPGASGCIFNWGAGNWLVNQIGGFPSAAGKNSMVQNEYIVSKQYSQL